jgi:hypothetical protein
MAFPLKIILSDGLKDIVQFKDVLTTVINRAPQSTDEVYLDLQKVSFISPYGLLGLLLLGKHVYESTGQKIHVFARKDKLIQYLERMDFFKAGDTWFNKPSILKKRGYKFSRRDESNKLLEIHKISTHENMGKFDVDEIVSKFRQRATVILDSFQQKMDVNFFIKVMTELCTNVYTHSQSDGYVAIQRYLYDKRGFEVVKLAVMDDGIGIKKSLLKRYDFKYQNECEYIKKAFEPRISGAGDRGFGLYEVKSIVENSHGYLWVNSGDSAILLQPHEVKFKEYVNIPFFKGTRIAIILAFERISFPLDKPDIF